jgi:hypothetical protein
MLFTLAVVGATYPLSPQDQPGIEYDANGLSALVNSFNAEDHVNFHVDADYLGHALCRYSKTLHDKLGWRFTSNSAEESRPRAIGLLTPYQRSRTVVLPKVEPGTEYTIHPDKTWDTAHRSHTILALAGQLLRWKYPKAKAVLRLAGSLGELLDHKLAYGALQALAAAQQQVAELQRQLNPQQQQQETTVPMQLEEEEEEEEEKEEGKEEGVLETPSVVSNDPRTVLLAAKRSTKKEDRTEAHTYCDAWRTMEGGVRGTKYFAEHGIPDVERRSEMVKKSMPKLLDTVFQALISQTHLITSRAAHAKMLMYSSQAENKSESQIAAMLKEAEYNDRANRNLRLALDICEIIAGAQSGSSVITPTHASVGVLLLLGNLSRRTMTILSSRQLCCSYGPANIVVDGYVEQRQADLKIMVDGVRGKEDRIALVLVDNYVTKQFKKTMHSDQKFTHLCATVAVLFCVMEKPPRSCFSTILLRCERASPLTSTRCGY